MGNPSPIHRLKYQASSSESPFHLFLPRLYGQFTPVTTKILSQTRKEG